MVEFALVAPVLAIFVLGVVSFWINYQKAATYTSAAQTAVELIARNGQYTPAMGLQIQSMLDDALAVGSDGAYLTIIVLDPNGNPLGSVGSVVPSGGPEGVPGDTGWGGSINDVVSGSLIQVDVWGYHSVGAPGFGVGLVIVPDGHAVMRSMWISAAVIP